MSCFNDYLSVSHRQRILPQSRKYTSAPSLNGAAKLYHIASFYLSLRGKKEIINEVQKCKPMLKKTAMIMNYKIRYLKDSLFTTIQINFN